jgi:hypothetical protein
VIQGVDCDVLFRAFSYLSRDISLADSLVTGSPKAHVVRSNGAIKLNK